MILWVSYRNLDICDIINASKDGPTQAIHLMTQRFRKNNAKITLLTLALSECCIKNCEKTFPSALSTSYLNEIASVASGKMGSENAKLAISLIEDLYREFKHINNHIVETWQLLVEKKIIIESFASGVNAWVYMCWCLTLHTLCDTYTYDMICCI